MLNLGGGQSNQAAFRQRAIMVKMVCQHLCPALAFRTMNAQKTLAFGAQSKTRKLPTRARIGALLSSRRFHCSKLLQKSYLPLYRCEVRALHAPLTLAHTNSRHVMPPWLA